MATTTRTRRRRRRPPRGTQLTFDDARKPEGKHGGWRPDAGRPAGRSVVAHDRRPAFPARNPVLVTWRLVEELPSLRHARYADIIFAGIAAVHVSAFRITDFSIQSNHLHLICEADGGDALADGMLRLAGRIARRLNRAMGRRGPLFADRYHDRALATPREMKNALRYVLNNARHHGEAIHLYYHPDWIDPFSSGRWFDGWRVPLTQRELDELDPHVRCATAEPHTWLRRVGWRRWGLLGRDEIPGGQSA